MPTAYGQASHPPMCSLLLSKLRPLLSHSPPFFAAPFRRRRSLAFSALPTKTKAVDAALLKEKWLESLTLPSPEEHVVTRESSYVIGVDPDLSGALALLKINHVLASSEAQVFDTPHLPVLVGKRVRKRLDAKSIVQLIQSLDIPSGSTAYIEQSTPFPKDGKQGWYSGGFGFGFWIGTLVTSGFSVVPVPSALWKRHFQLAGGNCTKDDSRRVASDLFPLLSSQLQRKKDHGRAEALLIAAYGETLKHAKLLYTPQEFVSSEPKMGSESEKGREEEEEEEEDIVCLDESFFVNDDYQLTTFTFGSNVLELYCLQSASTDFDLTGQLVWPGAMLMNGYLSDNADILQGCSVLEFGSGVGITGVLCSRFCRKVVFTDHNDEVLKILKKNIELHEHSSPSAELEAAKLEWGNTDHLGEILQKHSDGFDLILGADIYILLCSQSSVPLLFDSVEQLLRIRGHGNCKFILAYVSRARQMDSAILKEGSQHGMLMNEVPGTRCTVGNLEGVIFEITLI
ncbi:BnaC03g26630D [Brassica napus]|uniref:(rape) hypothetical protein n=1 Tax=Brassica napus TaxID=3708 RepID=A0A078HMH4_BRANA|nr:unnamed protein product [Brassica napus]CDY38534.1 BnaC03g26630D [Brassica napus]